MKKTTSILILFFLLIKPLNSPAREFLNTYLHINFVFMYSLTAFGEILDAEHDSYGIQDPDNDNKTVHPDHHDEAYGVVLDITPIPALVLGLEDHAVKFGLRVGYRFHSLQQELLLEKKNYGGDLMTFRTLMYGPVIYYAPSIEPARINRNFNASKGFVFYALFGKLSNGYMTAYPSMRDSNVAPPGDYESKVSGYKIDIGAGGEVSICGSVNIGLNLYYSRIIFKMDDQLYPNVNRNTSINEVCAEIYVGIPVQYW